MTDSRTGNATRETTEDRLAALDDEFPQLVVALWRRAGWTVVESPVDDRETAEFVAHSDDGRRRTRLCPFSPAEGVVTAAKVRGLVGDPGAAGDEVTAVSAMEFTAGALDVADAHGVDAVGPVAVGRLVDALDATDLLDDPPA